MLPKKRVLVIDDSAFVRQFLKDIFNNTQELMVTAAVSDPVKALALLKEQDFDVITMDIETPETEGLAFLQYLLRFNPKPVVVISSATQENSNTTMMALSMGVVAVIAKPVVGYKEGLELLAAEIVTQVKIAANTRINHTAPSHPSNSTPQVINLNRIEMTNRIIAIGASTGGTNALSEVFKNLHSELPGIIVIQHMPEFFTEAFAATLNQISGLQVNEAKDGQYISKGMAVVVPGGKNIALQKDGAQYVVKVSPRQKDLIYNPSIDYTFNSVADQVGKNAMGVILTGMGNDGAHGLRVMYDKGAFTIAQDEKTSVIYGMPHKAMEYGGVSKVVALDKIAQEINKWGLVSSN